MMVDLIKMRFSAFFILIFAGEAAVVPALSP